MRLTVLDSEKIDERHYQHEVMRVNHHRLKPNHRQKSMDAAG